jgi:uncharacterized protein YktA (UPF0223 family)
MVSDFTFFLTVPAIFIFAYLNKLRISKTLDFIQEMNSDYLTRRQYDDLCARYTGFLKFVEPFPDEKQYAKLYENKDFVSFKKGITWKLGLCAVFVAANFIATFVSA